MLESDGVGSDLEIGVVLMPTCAQPVKGRFPEHLPAGASGCATAAVDTCER